MSGADADAPAGPAISLEEATRVSAEVMPLDEATVRDLEPLVANLRALARTVDRAMRESDGVAASVDAVSS